MTKYEAIDLAVRRQRDTKRQHVVRNTNIWGQPRYAVVPLYMEGAEGRHFDLNSAQLGPIVWRKT